MPFTGIKNLLTVIILVVLVFAVIYAAPNLYPPDPAIQISGESASVKIDQRIMTMAEEALAEAEIEIKGSTLYSHTSSMGRP